MNITGEVGNYWVKQTLEIENPVDVTFQLILEGHLGEGDLSDIAVDDFVFMPYCK